MADIEVFHNFGALDGLMQVIYHSFSCFVLVSEVGVANWEIELGLVEENQWWKASWSTEDVTRQVEKPVTERNIETLSEKLASLIVSGELSIKGWSDSRSKDLRLMIGTDTGIDLKKLPDDECSTRAIELLKKIALRAQLHDCQLFKAGSSGPVSSKDNNKDNAQILVKAEEVEEKEHELEEAQKRIKELESQVSVVKQMIMAERETTKPVVPKVPRGSSRANPTKQKRKIVEAEFESD